MKSPNIKMPRLVIAATSSGSGKTTITTGILSALRQRGIKVQSYKIGPDYIDPGYHRLANGQPGHNLDSWLMSKDKLKEIFARTAGESDIAVIEGVMGLYDGGNKGISSTAEIAKLLKAPVLLVINCKSMGASAAAIALGFRNYDPEVQLAGVILNRLGSDNHERMIAEALGELGIPVYGAIRRNDELTMPERHLGLLPVEENKEQSVIDRIGQAVGSQVDLDGLLALAQGAEPLEVMADDDYCAEYDTNANAGAAAAANLAADAMGNMLDSAAVNLAADAMCHMAPNAAANSKVDLAATTDAEASSIGEEICRNKGSIGQDNAHKVRIAVAKDDAFSFYYPESLRVLEKYGAEIVTFSPLADKELPKADGLILGGGFPEMFASQLSANAAMQNSVRRAAEAGMPIYAECGGFMYLTNALVDFEGYNYPMTGVLPCYVEMKKKLQMVGYVEAELQAASVLGPKGTKLHGHEFHFSTETALYTDITTKKNHTADKIQNSSDEQHSINNTDNAACTAQNAAEKIKYQKANGADIAEAGSGCKQAFTFTRLRNGAQYGAGYVNAQGNVLGSYLHIHFAGCEYAARNFVEHCRSYRDAKGKD